MGSEEYIQPLELSPDIGPRGFGLVPSPMKASDWPVLAAIEAVAGIEAAAIVLPEAFVAPHMPPVYDQGVSPQCVAFSDAAIKAQQDRPEGGQFFNFDESEFFRRIGGGPGGAVLRNGMEELVSRGYPLYVLGQAGQHKIKAYYDVPSSIDAIKQAIFTLGPIQMGFHWYNSWMRPYVNGVLPQPDWYNNNHAIVAYGWDWRGLRLRNSWSARWGDGGDAFMPWWMATGSANFECFKLVDALEVARDWGGRIMLPGPEANVRDMSKHVWATSRHDGFTYRHDGVRLWSNKYNYLFNGERDGEAFVVKTHGGKFLKIHRSVAVITVYPRS